jgi:hypothetical protein
MAKFGKEIGEVVSSHTLRRIELSILEAGNAWERVAGVSWYNMQRAAKLPQPFNGAYISKPCGIISMDRKDPDGKTLEHPQAMVLPD